MYQFPNLGPLFFFAGIGVIALIVIALAALGGFGWFLWWAAHHVVIM
jgi:hypothetical protein